jgi:hypothetical protein
VHHRNKWQIFSQSYIKETSTLLIQILRPSTLGLTVYSGVRW